ncbi:tRNA-dihydrouridine synthase [Acetobacteraceae bacterium]|nr:tRNA-dihydrouridine synthase [Candidatus Parcubacteria bacterium]
MSTSFLYPTQFLLEVEYATVYFMQGFWGTLPKPFFALAPLADVTDAAFRRIIAKYSKPDGLATTSEANFVMYTEFVSADGLALAPEEGRAKLMRDLIYSEGERPIVAQFFSSTPEYMEKAAALAQELGFDGVDINMGCPIDTIVDQGSGAALIKNSALAVSMIEAAQRGAPNLPVSVKTRLGYNTDILEEWLPALLSAKPAAIALHARTRKEMSKVPAHWERIRRAVEIRNEVKSETLIIGNGDVLDLEDAKAKAEVSGADGVMLGRAIFGKPWLFSETFQHSVECWNVEKRLKVAVEHTQLFEELLGDIKSFAIMKKHFKAYVEGFSGAKELRMELMEAKSAGDVERIVENFLSKSALA